MGFGQKVTIEALASLENDAKLPNFNEGLTI